MDSHAGAAEPGPGSVISHANQLDLMFINRLQGRQPGAVIVPSTKPVRKVLTRLSAWPAIHVIAAGPTIAIGRAHLGLRTRMVRPVLPAAADSATERPSSGRFFDCTRQQLVPALDVSRGFSFRRFRRDRETALRYNCFGQFASQELNRGILISAIPIAMCRQLRRQLWQVLRRPDYAVASDSRDVSGGAG